jgi:hypothetical protein
VALALLPIVLLVLDRNWIFPTLIHDPWIYLGFGIDPWRMLARYHWLYFANRLTVILPLAAVHGVLPALWAHLFIHLLLYYASVFSLRALIVHRIGPRTACLAPAIMGSYFFFLDAIARDHPDAFGITYVLLATWLMDKNGTSRMRPIYMVAAGACLAALIVANVSYAIVAPFPVLCYVTFQGRHRSFRGIASDLFFTVAGALALCGSLAIFYRWVAGDPFFLRASVAFTRQAYSAQGPLLVNGRLYFKFDDPAWVMAAVWLALPFAVALGSAVIVWLRFMKRPGSRGVAGWIWSLLYLGVFLLLGVMEIGSSRSVFLQGWANANLLIPAMMLALSALLGSRLELFDDRWWSICTASGWALLVGQAAIPWSYAYSDDLALWPLLTSFLAAVLAIGALGVKRGPRTFLGSLILLACSMFACRAGFSEDNSSPVFGPQRFSSSSKTAVQGGPLPYVQRMHFYDKHRAEVYLAIVDCVREIRSMDKRNDVIFWFDMLDPHGILYDNLACTRNWSHSILNLNFPRVTSALTLLNREIGVGQLIAIPSIRDDVYDYAKLALAGIGFGARLIDRREIAHGAIKFTITLIELEPLEVKGRTDTREAVAAPRASSASLPVPQSSTAHAATERASFFRGMMTR